MAINLSNPVLTRELRASLRNARAFALLALYVALLGAFVTANFPADQALDLQHDGGRRANDLFQTIFFGQIVLILVIIPALATGALAQERERQTLQPLLLTPLSPLQIV
ncbi:MAG: ABC transporter permease, partial [Cytophagaceae bacterium]